MIHDPRVHPRPHEPNTNHNCTLIQPKRALRTYDSTRVIQRTFMSFPFSIWFSLRALPIFFSTFDSQYNIFISLYPSALLWCGLWLCLLGIQSASLWLVYWKFEDKQFGPLDFTVSCSSFSNCVFFNCFFWTHLQFVCVFQIFCFEPIFYWIFEDKNFGS